MLLSRRQQRDMVCEALAQLLLATSEPVLEGDRWVMYHNDLPPAARKVTLSLRGNPNSPDEPTFLSAPLRYFFEKNILFVAETLLKNGYCYSELAAECHEILAARRRKTA